MLAIVASYASAETQVGGAITSNVTWQATQSPIVVTSDILVHNGATLTIEPGTVVYMGGDTRLLVQSGTLHAVGTAGAPITITSQKLQNNQTAAPGDWQQIIFNNGISNATRLEHVIVEYGKGIIVNGATLTFNFVSIKNNQGAAITSDLNASLIGSGNTASGNTINAVVVPDGDISGSVTWGLRGIPYAVLSGVVSVGTSPKITAITPSSLQQGETQTITLTGTRLSGFTNPKFSLAGISAEPLSNATSTQVQLQITASNNAETGTAALTALTDAGEVKYSNALSIISTQPKLTTLAPSTISTHQGDTVISLKGQNFSTQSVAYMDAVALATNYVSATEISATIPNQIVDAVKSINLHTPNPANAGAEFISNDLPLAVVTPSPVVTTITPAGLRISETKDFEITGTGLGAVELSVSNPSLVISNIVRTPTKASFRLAVAANASTGKYQLTVKNASATTSVNITINPALPVAVVAPTPVAVPPDGSSRQFAVQLSFADTDNHSFTVTSADTEIVSTSTPSLTIAAGKTQVVGTLIGHKVGVTSLTLTSPTLGTMSVPVYVTSEFIGLNTANSPLVGVVRTIEPQIAQTSVSPYSSHVGVVVGSVIQNMSPKAFSIGSGPNMLTISGSGLQGATAVSIKPADGVTVGAMSIANDGKSINVPITVASDAPVSQRQIVILSSAGTPYPVAAPGADRILVTLPLPEVYSVEPLVATPGTSSLNLVLRGRNLQGVQSVNAAPADGITFGSSYTINPDGTELAVGMAIAPSASVGPHVITVSSPTGTSDANPSAANRFSVVNQVVSNVTPVTSPLLGIIKQADTAANTSTRDIFARSLGVAIGPVAVSVSPRAKAIGETFTLTVHGHGLQGITGLGFTPATGLTIGPITIAEDGRSLTAQVTIAADAPQTARTLKLQAGATQVVFVNPSESLFTVTALLPTIDSITPVVMQLGAPATTLTVRGQNFHNVQAVRFVSPDGMTVSSSIAVNANGTELSVNVSAASNAAPGQRALVLTTIGGETSEALTPANTVILTNSAPIDSHLIAPLLGIVKQTADTAVLTTTVDPVVAPNVGVIFGETNSAASQKLATSTPLGVAFGAVVSEVQPKNVAVSTSAMLTISGTGLNDVTSVVISPSEGITIGTPLQATADGLQVTVPVTIAADAPQTMRKVELGNASSKIATANPNGMTLKIGSNLVPQITSISPILSSAGSLVTLKILGQDLKNASAVIATPPDGLIFDTQPTVKEDGTEITVRIQISPDAPLGSRVIQVLTPTTSSTPVESPANKFTVHAP